MSEDIFMDLWQGRYDCNDAHSATRTSPTLEDTQDDAMLERLQAASCQISGRLVSAAREEGCGVSGWNDALQEVRSSDILLGPNLPDGEDTPAACIRARETLSCLVIGLFFSLLAVAACWIAIQEFHAGFKVPLASVVSLAAATLIMAGVALQQDLLLGQIAHKNRCVTTDDQRRGVNNAAKQILFWNEEWVRGYIGVPSNSSAVSGSVVATGAGVECAGDVGLEKISYATGVSFCAVLVTLFGWYRHYRAHHPLPSKAHVRAVRARALEQEKERLRKEREAARPRYVDLSLVPCGHFMRQVDGKILIPAACPFCVAPVERAIPTKYDIIDAKV